LSLTPLGFAVFFRVIGCRGNKADASIGKNGLKTFRNKFAAIITAEVLRILAVVVMYDFKPDFDTAKGVVSVTTPRG
jgi:hypothetical protein